MSDTTCNRERPTQQIIPFYGAVQSTVPYFQKTYPKTTGAPLWQFQKIPLCKTTLANALLASKDAQHRPTLDPFCVTRLTVLR